MLRDLVGVDEVEHAVFELVQVEGHTDNETVRSRAYPTSNWQLSAARAITVVEGLFRLHIPTQGFERRGRYGLERLTRPNVAEGFPGALAQLLGQSIDRGQEARVVICRLSERCERRPVRGRDDLDGEEVPGAHPRDISLDHGLHAVADGDFASDRSGDTRGGITPHALEGLTDELVVDQRHDLGFEEVDAQGIGQDIGDRQVEGLPVEQDRPFHGCGRPNRRGRLRIVGLTRPGRGDSDSSGDSEARRGDPDLAAPALGDERGSDVVMSGGVSSHARNVRDGD